MVIPPITPHWLRHTYATMLYNAGVDMMTAKTLLGHADIKTTLGIYTHLDQRHKRLEVAKLDDFLSDASHDASQRPPPTRSPVFPQKYHIVNSKSES